MAKLTMYLDLFEEKLEALRKNIKKAEENGDNSVRLQRLRKQAKDIEKSVSEMRDHHVVHIECPKCKEKIRVDAADTKLKTS